MRPVDEYRLARDAQDRRFEAANGSVSVRDTHTREYRDWFGLRGCCGRPMEERITFRRWLELNRGRREHY